jgi:hypothetical protein
VDKVDGMVAERYYTIWLESRIKTEKHNPDSTAPGIYGLKTSPYT